MRYRGVLMDADDTLFDFQTANRRAVARLMDELDYRHPDRYDQYEEINLGCWAALERGEMNQAELKVARFARFFEAYGLPGDAAAAGERFVQLLGEQAVMLPGAEDVVRALAARLPVLILTNGITAVQRSRLARSPIAQVVSGAVISEEEGVSKPDPALFDIALRRLGIDRREALMIGDGTGSDVRGANNAGVDVCWFNPRHKSLPEGLHVEYEIDDLARCLPIALG